MGAQGAYGTMHCWAFLRRSILNSTSSASDGESKLNCLTGLAFLNHDKVSSWLPVEVFTRFDESLQIGKSASIEDQKLIVDAIEWCVHVKRYRHEHRYVPLGQGLRPNPFISQPARVQAFQHRAPSIFHYGTNDSICTDYHVEAKIRDYASPSGSTFADDVTSSTLENIDGESVTSADMV